MTESPPSAPEVEEIPHAPVILTVHLAPDLTTPCDFLMRPHTALTSLGWYGIALWAAVVLIVAAFALS